jgi:hypothetical protein
MRRASDEAQRDMETGIGRSPFWYGRHQPERRQQMTTVNDRILVLEEYKQWRESQEVDGKPSGLDAWAEYLIARESIEKLEKIRDLAVKLGPEPIQVDGINFALTVRGILGLNSKEITA